MKDLKVTMKSTMRQEYIPQQEIPDIDLYVDQIITLMEARLGRARRTEEDKIITKTMVNNYAKAGLFKRIKGKKYSHEHILMIMLIYGLKQGIAVQDIARIFSGLEGNLSNAAGDYDPQAVASLYQEWGNVGQAVSEKLPDFVDEMVRGIHSASKDDPMPAIMVLSQMSEFCRRTAEALIDENFPEKDR